MTETQTCPKCGAELPANAPAGLCPVCLMQAALASEQAAGSNPQLKPTTATTGFVPPAAEELAKHFSQLEVLELVGAGGMGAVYKARQRGLDRLVAVKILPPEIGQDTGFAERFTREARALARLSHSHIVSVYDFGQADGLFFIVMEYVDGVNLRHTIQSGGLTPQAALAIVPQICEALQYAHDEGIVHRDIKPENILIDKKGRVKIADFGLAKLLGREATDHSLTGTHQVMGTVRYMAPEQMEASRAVDHRADIYSLGVVFYEMLTGELPLGRFAPPSEKVQVDVRLDEVVLRSLAKEPERRYQQASEVKTEVEQIAKSGVLVRPERQSLVVARSGLASQLTWAASILVCLIGIASSITVPWLEVRDVDGGGHVQWQAFDLKEPMLAAFGFLACGVVVLVLPNRGQAHLWRAILQIGAALLVIIATGVFFTASRAEFVSPEGTRAINFAFTEHGEDYDMRNSRPPKLAGPVGPHFTLGWGVVLLFLGAWQLRTALSQHMTINLLREDVRKAFEHAPTSRTKALKGSSDRSRWWLLPRVATVVAALAGGILTAAPWQSVEIRAPFTQGSIVQWFLSPGYESGLGLAVGLLFSSAFVGTLATFHLRRVAMPTATIAGGLIIVALMFLYLYHPPLADRTEVADVVAKLHALNPGLQVEGLERLEVVRQAHRAGLMDYWKRLILAFSLTFGMALLVVICATTDWILVRFSPASGSAGMKSETTH